MNNLAIIGTSHTFGAYNKEENNSPSSVNVLDGWCADIAKKYKKKTWVFSHGGGGIEETLFYLEMIRKFWPKNFFSKIIIESSCEPRHIIRKNFIYKLYLARINENKTTTFFVTDKPSSFYGMDKFRLENILTSGVINHIDFHDHLLFFDSFIEVIHRTEYDYIKLAPVGPVFQCTDPQKPEHLSNINQADWTHIADHIKSFYFNEWRKYNIEFMFNTCSLYKDKLEADMLFFPYEYFFLENNNRYLINIDDSDVILKKQPYLSWLTKKVGKKQFLLFVQDSAYHLNAEGQQFLVSEYLKSELNSFLCE